MVSFDNGLAGLLGFSFYEASSPVLLVGKRSAGLILFFDPDKKCF